MPRTKKPKYEQPRNPDGVNQYIKGTVKKSKADKTITLRLEVDLDEKLRELPDFRKLMERWIRQGYESEYGTE